MTKNKNLNINSTVMHLFCCFCISLLFVAYLNVASAQLPDEKNDQLAPSNKTSSSSPKSSAWGQPGQGRSILNIQPLSVFQSLTLFTFKNNVPITNKSGSSRNSGSSIGLVSLGYEFGLLPEMALTLSTGFYSSSSTNESESNGTTTSSKSKSSGMGDTSLGIKNDFNLGGAHFINGFSYRFSSAKPIETNDSSTESTTDSNMSGSLGDFSLTVGTYFQPAHSGIVGFSVQYTGPYTAKIAEKNPPPDSKTVNEYKYNYQSSTKFSAWVETVGGSVAHIVTLNYHKGGDYESINVNTNASMENKSSGLWALTYLLDAKINQNFHFLPAVMAMTNASNPYSDTMSTFVISAYAATLSLKVLF